MKTKMLLVTILIAILLFSTVNSIPAAFAEYNETENEQDLATTKIANQTEEEICITEYPQLENTFSGNAVTMRHGDKTRQYRRGVFSAETMCVTDENYIFNLANYDWYNVAYNNGYILVADIASNTQEAEEIFAVALFIFPAGIKENTEQQTCDVDTATTPSVQIVYVDIDETVCTKIITPITDASFEEFASCATEWNLSKENTDEISRNLIESFSYENNFKLRMYNADSMQNLTESQISTMSASYGSYANSKKTVSCNAYDNYTDTDSFIHDYISTYRGNSYKYNSVSANINYSDDPIVKIIPKQLFINRNTYSYIGLEYGFCVKTVQDTGNDNISNYIVFDIQTVAPYPERTNSNPFSVTIVPLFSGIVSYSASKKLVTCENYGDPKLALANISVGVSVQNANQKNIGDAGYDAYQDYGYAISSYAVDAKGVGQVKKESSVGVGFLGWVAGIIGEVGKSSKFSKASIIIGAIDFVCDIYNQHSKYLALNKAGTQFTCSDYLVGNTNTNSMISNYGNLVKGFETKLLNSNKAEEEQYPLFYKNSNHYYRANYAFCQKNSDINWDAYVASYVSLDIYQDNTSKNIFKPGQIELIDSVIGGRIDSYNERPSDTQCGNVQEDTFYHTCFVKDNYADEESHEDESYLPTSCSYRDFYFTPNRTFWYVIETFNLSPDTDPYLKIYDSQNNLVRSDDDSGGNGRAKISMTLTGGQTYKIRTMCHRYKSGAYDFIIRKNEVLTPASRTELNPNTVTLQNDSIWFSYVPMYDDYYTFSSVGSVDTYFTLYDNEYNRLTWDDDSGLGRNANIDMYLKGGRTYYLKVNVFGMGSGQFNIYLNRQKSLFYDAVGKPQFFYSAKSDSAQFFRFTPLETKTYFITTKMSVSGDPYMELYDSEWNLLTYNDDGGEGNNAQLEYAMQAGQTYYIKVRNYSAALVEGYIYF